MSDDWGAWVGASGTEYNFHPYGLDQAMPARQGLYIYCRRDEQGRWMPIYIGHGDLAVRCGDADLLACIASKGATHLHMRLCRSAEECRAEVADLLEHYRNAFAPWGCNVASPGTAATASQPRADPLAPARA